MTDNLILLICKRQRPQIYMRRNRNYCRQRVVEGYPGGISLRMNDCGDKYIFWHLPKLLCFECQLSNMVEEHAARSGQWRKWGRITSLVINGLRSSMVLKSVIERKLDCAEIGLLLAEK